MTDTTRPVPGQSGNNLDTDSVNELLTAVLRLTAEVSALRERVNIWERVLEARGFPVTGGVQSFAAAASEERLVADERDRMLLDAMASLRLPATQVKGEPTGGGPERTRAA